jgi:Uncharacterized conserved protein (DUF2249)
MNSEGDEVAGMARRGGVCGDAIAQLDLSGHASELARVLECVAALPREGLLKLSGARDEAALRAALESHGVSATCEPAARRGAEPQAAARLELRPAGAAPILDLRALEAPEPLQRILEAVARLAPGQALLARTPRPPHMLFPQLEHRGLAWQAVEEPDGSGLVHIRRPG